VVSTRKVYDFPMERVEGQLVSFLKRRRNESTIADMIAGTGLPKYQVERAARVALDEYAGQLKVTESGELLYSFPSGMRSTKRGFGPAARRFLKSFLSAAARVLSFLFKIWIVVMLVGYFLVFVALVVLAVVASMAASAAGSRDRGGRSRRGGDGFGAMFLVMRLFDLVLRMWFTSSLLQGVQGSRQRRPPGRPFYKSVFGFVFGEGEANPGWDTAEKTHVISYIRSKRGVMTIEELMTLTGRDSEEAQALINRYLLEFEGEPRVTDDGTIIFAFPELLRTTESEQKSFGSVSLSSPIEKSPVPFSANKKRTNGWIGFFNAFNLLFGSVFLFFPLTPGMSFVVGIGPESQGRTDFLTFLYYITYHGLQSLGVANPVPLISIALGIVPVAFSVLFFLIPLLRKIRLDRQNQTIQEENLKKRIYAHILANPSHVDPRNIGPDGAESTPKRYDRVRDRIVRRFAALKSAEPVQQADGAFAYRFTELERELADVEEYRKKVDLKSFEVGKTIFDSGQ
jgi:hypothetical protein